MVCDVCTHTDVPIHSGLICSRSLFFQAHDLVVEINQGCDHWSKGTYPFSVAPV